MLKKTNINTTNLYLLTLYIFIFSLPFGFKTIQICLGILLLGWAIWIISIKFKPKINITKNKKIYFIAIFILFFLHIIGLTYSKNVERGLYMINLKLYFIAFPIMIITSLEHIKIKTLLNTFAAANITASLILLLRATITSIKYQQGQLIFQPTINPTETFFNSVTNSGNHFFYTNFSAFMHPAYMSILILIAISILLYNNKITPSEKTIINKILSKKIIKIASITILIITILLLSSRTNLLTLLLLFVSSIILSKIKYKYIILIATLVISATLLYTNERFNSLIHSINENKIQFSQLQNKIHRLYIWEKSIKIIKENKWLGTGTGSVKNELKKQLKNTELNEINNSHNEFIETYLRLGIPGLISIIFIFIYGIYLSHKTKNPILLHFFLIFTINLLFESMFNRALGTLYFAIFYSLIIFVGFKNKTLSK